MSVATPSPIGIAQMRSVYRCADVQKKLERLPAPTAR